MIFDSNILIYLTKKELEIQSLIKPSIQPAISIISYIEVMGYRFETTDDKLFTEQICKAFKVIELDQLIVNRTIELRQKYQVKLPDAIIYATAFISGKPLMTNNIRDFLNLDGSVTLLNPFDDNYKQP